MRFAPTREKVADLSVLHIGAGRYSIEDLSHPTLEIWRSLASGFKRYTVVGRSIEANGARLDLGNLSIRLLPSWVEREAEFLMTQFQAVRVAADVRPDVVVCQSPVLGGLAALAIKRRWNSRVIV
jgi:hypothetical protein